MTRAIPTILLLFLTAASLRAQDEKPAEIRRHDVRSLMSALAETSVRFPFTTSPVRTGGAGESAVRSLWGQRSEDVRQDDAIQEIVRFALRCDAEPDDCRERLFATDGWLQVSGPARFHEQVPRVLADLRRRPRRRSKSSCRCCRRRPSPRSRAPSSIRRRPTACSRSRSRSRRCARTCARAARRCSRRSPAGPT